MIRDADVETMLLGPVLPGRECGACTICCTVLRVDSPDFRKPEDTPCRHLGTQGCTIHAVRPDICRTWFCAWRRVEGMAEEARPDRSGLLVSLNFERAPRNCFEAVSLTVRLLPGSDAISNGIAAAVLDALCDGLVPVWFSDGEEKMLMHPDREVAEAVLSGAPPPAAIAPEVRAWRDHYRLFAAADRPTAG